MIGRPALPALLVLGLNACGAAVEPAAYDAAPDAVSPDAAPGVDPDVSAVAVVRIANEHLGAEVPLDFIGLSVEYTSVGSYLGRVPDQLNPAFIELLANLGDGVLRIGGNSQDDGCWRTSPGEVLPSACTFEVSLNALQIVSAAVREAGWRAIMGVNMSVYSPSRALDFARDGVAVAFSGPASNRLVALELGNEPNLYTNRGSRPASYTHGDSVAEWIAYHDALQADATTATMPSAGPAYARMSIWYDLLETFVTSTGDGLGLITVHEYPLQDCLGETPTIAELLSPELMAGTRERISSLVNVGATHGKLVRVAESNSVACRGHDGVSNVFASALWALDHLLTIAETGAVGANLHNAKDGFYDPIVSQESGPDANGNWSYSTRVLPSYYGMLLASRVAGATLLTSEVEQTDVALVSHAARAPDRTVLVYLINKDLAGRGGTVKVTPSTRLGTAQAITLAAPSLEAHAEDVTLGGVQIEDATGRLPVPEMVSLEPTAGTGSYLIDVPAATAVLLSIAPD